MYTFINNTGEVIRNSDNILIAPCNDKNDPAYLEYIEWVETGGEPVIIDSPGDDYYYYFGQFLEKLEIIKERKLLELNEEFSKQFQYGQFVSSLGFKVDNRRYGDKNDKDNIQSLMDLDINVFKDADGNFHNLTLEQLQIIKNEMAGDGLKKYQIKWYFEGLIQATDDPVLLEEIVISF